jgi:rfaE bifunctional protein nucleotidyltransferase chain/domain
MMMSAPVFTPTDCSGLASYVESVRRAGMRIVTTNGCFDLFHIGHLATLTFAKTQGDFLVVGVDTDEHVTQLKGPARPIVPLVQRMRMLAHLRCVDLVTPIDDVETFLWMVRPDVHVKGADYQGRNLREAIVLQRLSIRLEFAPFVPGVSTTRIIDRASQQA